MTVSIGRDNIAGIAAAVRAGEITARALVEQALDRIAERDGQINAVTRVLQARALADADAVDARRAAGEDPGILAGVPFGVKDLFDVAGLPTTAGAQRLADAPSAKGDALVVSRLRQAGAVLVATLNMDEFAYGFVTDNSHWGMTCNPRDTARFAGGSSGGSAAAVAAGMVCFALGSDTNGSIRIPASLCGLFGLKPTHGSLPVEGTYPFVHTLDDVGAFASSAEDLALVDLVMRGGGDALSFPSQPRLARLGGWFARNLSPEMEAAMGRFCDALGELTSVEIEDVERARSAAFLITAYEGGRLHAEALRADPLSYDPATRDRLIAGASLPDDLYREAMDLRAHFDARVDGLFGHYDVLVAPTTFGPAPRIDEPIIPIDGKPQPARANLGLYTQPISYLGLPALSAPLAGDGLPLGVQLIARKGADRALLGWAAELESRGLIKSPPTKEW